LGSISVISRPKACARHLEDGVVSLHRITLGDVETVMAWDADPEVQRWFDWPLRPATPETVGARRSSAERTVRDKEAAWDLGTEYTFIVRRAGGDRGLGWVALQPLGAGRGNVSYAILPEERGRGVATRALVLRVPCTTAGSPGAGRAS
jgi:RimJ/RimL family protein N-acetyltransferase